MLGSQPGPPSRVRLSTPQGGGRDSNPQHVPAPQAGASYRLGYRRRWRKGRPGTLQHTPGLRPGNRQLSCPSVHPMIPEAEKGLTLITSTPCQASVLASQSHTGIPVRRSPVGELRGFEPRSAGVQGVEPCRPGLESGRPAGGTPKGWDTRPAVHAAGRGPRVRRDSNPGSPQPIGYGRGGPRPLDDYTRTPDVNARELI